MLWTGTLQISVNFSLSADFRLILVFLVAWSLDLSIEMGSSSESEESIEIIDALLFLKDTECVASGDTVMLMSMFEVGDGSKEEAVEVEAMLGKLVGAGTEVMALGTEFCVWVQFAWEDCMSVCASVLPSDLDYPKGICDRGINTFCRHTEILHQLPLFHQHFQCSEFARVQVVRF